MANTGKKPQTVYDRVVKVLREQFRTRSYIKKVFEGDKTALSPNELPCIIVKIAGRDETVISDYPFVTEVELTLGIFGILDVFDPRKENWVGQRGGKGLGDLDEDIKAAFETEATTRLNETCDYFTFGSSVYTDDFPQRQVMVPMSIFFKQETRDRD